MPAVREQISAIPGETAAVRERAFDRSREFRAADDACRKFATGFD